MRYVKLGRTGLDISPLVLGCMTYGVPDRGNHAWTLDEEESRPFIRKALDLGINFFDTANAYSDGTSEEIVGRALKDFARRDEVVLATKTFYRWREGPNTGGLSRKAIFHSVDDSLRRLGTDYIDLLQIHRFDHGTPVEETMEALHDVVKAGKVRYLGASSMYAWQFAKMVYTSRLHGWTEFVSMQDHYNLLQREEEREMIPFCIDQGIAVIPWSPLARGRLTRDWDETSTRQESDVFGSTLYNATVDSDKAIVAAVKKVAEGRGVPRAQVALSWVAHRKGVTAPIVGASKPHHLDDAVAAIDLVLSPEETAMLEAAYGPHPIEGFE
ncbi:aldo/keto reductase [Luteibacter sp. SG786]|uniref:aldo/keto reductase n=1 Tax=Luteibacter sp. SG786 TaxID=2587130 RepID=UPI001421E952|nr:aldo/keto reductase [Luteibacter sp. SG786]NII55094.1 aryl-alcohol dehydrogenase-like predicted oxidoreductase [Luteibacter sp. SG786]